MIVNSSGTFGEPPLEALLPDPSAAHLGVGEVVLHAARQADARAVDEANQAQTGGRQQAAVNRDIEYLSLAPA